MSGCGREEEVQYYTAEKTMSVSCTDMVRFDRGDTVYVYMRERETGLGYITIIEC